jgi:hypothetical protein
MIKSFFYWFFCLQHFRRSILLEKITIGRKNIEGGEIEGGLHKNDSSSLPSCCYIQNSV